MEIYHGTFLSQGGRTVAQSKDIRNYVYNKAIGWLNLEALETLSTNKPYNIMCISLNRSGAADVR